MDFPYFLHNNTSIFSANAEDDSKTGFPADEHSGQREDVDIEEISQSLLNMAANVTDLLDRITSDWVLQGAAIIENGEIRFRKLQKALVDKVTAFIYSRASTSPGPLGHPNALSFEKFMFKPEKLIPPFRITRF